jgi:glycosyltransferase involved in cell wall biosynthesis
MDSSAKREFGKRLKIAFVGGRGVISKYSGIETYYEEVGKALAESGHDVRIYCRSYFTPKVKSHNGMRIIRIPAPKLKHLETFFHTGLSTLHAVFSDHDIIHYHALGPSVFSFIPRMFGKKTVVTVQGLDWQREKWGLFARWFLKVCESMSIKFPNSTTVVSRFLQSYYTEKYGRVPYCVPNGVNMPVKRVAEEILKYGLKPGRYILFVGRLSPEKNCHLLIDAYKKLDTDVKLVFAGGNAHKDRYVMDVMKNENGNIRFLGYVSGRPLEELLSNALIFVLPSTIEGISIALLEAMSYGNCVLVSDIPENIEAVQDAGFSFRSGDVDELEHMLKFLLENDSIREQAGERAERLVREKYLWSILIRDIENVYYTTLAN